jgi:hypothetical protein
VLLKHGEFAFFVYGFAKNNIDNIGDDELLFYRSVAQKYFALTDGQISDAASEGELIEIQEAENEEAV